MKIALAQTRPTKGDIVQNIKTTQDYIEKAATWRSDLILFSELSLTAYEPELADKLATEPTDPRLDELQRSSDIHQMIIGLGLPVRTGGGIHISLLFFRPQAPRLIYSKQLLHEDELPYFLAGTDQIIIKYQGLHLAPAICYEAMQPEHAEKANQMGAQIYLASVAKDQKGVEKAYRYFPELAQNYQMPILMANAIGYCDHFESAGSSAVWDKKGRLRGQLPRDETGILLWDTQSKELVKSIL